jgi:hypothetical protein
VAKDICFIVLGLEAVGITVQTPVMVKVDNVGAIFMAENVSATNHTKHINTQYHFVHEFVEDGMIKILFTKSKTIKQICSQFTKNASGEVYDDYVESFAKISLLMAEQHVRVLECTGQLLLFMILYACMCAAK